MPRERRAGTVQGVRASPFRLGLAVAGVAALVVAATAASASAQQVPLKLSDRREINAVLDAFVRTAVRRRDPAAAWPLVTSNLRGGASRWSWVRGDLPVYPYPAKGRRFHDWTLAFSYRNSIGLDLLLQPVHRLRKKVGAIMFAVDLRRQRGHWRVDAFNPSALYAPVGQRPRMWTQADVAPAQGQRTGEPRLGGRWWAAVLAPLAVLPFAVVAAWLIAGVRQRRAAGERWRRRPSPLPELPKATRTRV